MIYIDFRYRRIKLRLGRFDNFESVLLDYIKYKKAEVKLAQELYKLRLSLKKYNHCFTFVHGNMWHVIPWTKNLYDFSTYKSTSDPVNELNAALLYPEEEVKLMFIRWSNLNRHLRFNINAVDFAKHRIIKLMAKLPTFVDAVSLKDGSIILRDLKAGWHHPSNTIQSDEISQYVKVSYNPINIVEGKFIYEGDVSYRCIKQKRVKSQRTET